MSIKPFSTTQSMYRGQITLGEEQSRDLVLYIEYCRNKGLIEEDKNQPGNGKVAMEILMGKILCAYVEEDKDYQKWKSKNNSGKPDLARYFEQRKYKV